MRLRVFTFLILGSLISIALAGQQATTPAGQRDPQALAVLSQMAAATGWSAGNLPSDAVATGRITRYRGDTQETLPFTLKAKGCREFRVDVQETTGPRSTVVNGSSGNVTRPDGPHPLPPRSASSMQPVPLPFFCVLAVLQKASSSVIYAGTETVAGQFSHRIEMSTEAITADSLTDARRRGAVFTLWVSTLNGIPTQVATTLLASENPTAALTLTSALSDYRAVNGLAVPFHQEVRGSGNLLYSVAVDSVNFSVSLSDSEFAVPAQP
ncbi:MAG: hypothetical protein DMG32_22720 [Acidobacteria bacterium]|nr:MAG: hypothetical protein DMG32_22720 [Acidobacteriota bacterium]